MVLELLVGMEQMEVNAYIIQMSKWKKGEVAPTKDFQENQERRKQLIIEAAKRRKDKERRLQEQEEATRRAEEEALVRHKQEKKDAYVRYLRNNIHDKYQQMKRQQKEKGPEINSVSKWKKHSLQKDKQLQALDLDVQRQISPHPSPIPLSNQRQQMVKQFQKEWDFDHPKDELLSSKLLDSLDLDFGTIRREKEVAQMIKDQKKSTQVGKGVLEDLRDLIGYESVVVIEKPKQLQEIGQNKIKEQLIPVKGEQADKGRAEINEVQVFNELRKKKEGKIFHWAIQQEAEAQDLFSNCSSKKKSAKTLKQLNQEIKGSNKIRNIKKTGLEAIVEVREKESGGKRQIEGKREHKIKQESNETNIKEGQRSVKQVRAQSRDKVRQIQKKISNEKTQRSISVEKDKKNSTSTSSMGNKKEEIIIKNEGSRTISGFENEKKNVTRIRNVSREKRETNSKESKEAIKIQLTNKVETITKNEITKKKIAGMLPPLPRVQNQYTQATHDVQFEIQSFIKNELINLNQEERKVQQQLRKIHVANKGKVKEVEGKYEIRTNYRHSKDVGQPDAPTGWRKPQTEDQLQESIQRLDNMLIRQQLYSREKSARDEEQQSVGSIINPFSSPADFQRQVLQLASNISRFEKKSVEQVEGYATKQKAKKGAAVVKMEGWKRQAVVVKVQDREELSESKDISYVGPIAQPPSIYNPSEESKFKEQDQQPKQRICVNEKLRRMLLEDD